MQGWFSAGHGDAEAQKNLGLATKHKGKLPAALGHFQAALKLSGGRSLSLMLKVADSLVKLGKKAEATKTINDAAALLGSIRSEAVHSPVVVAHYYYEFGALLGIKFVLSNALRDLLQSRDAVH